MNPLKKYRVKETGEVLQCTSPAVLVDLLNQTARMPASSAHEYMLSYARRSVLYRDVDIRATDFASFVEDLVKVGDLEVL